MTVILKKFVLRLLEISQKLTRLPVHSRTVSLIQNDQNSYYVTVIYYFTKLTWDHKISFKVDL